MIGHATSSLMGVVGLHYDYVVSRFLGRYFNSANQGRKEGLGNGWYQNANGVGFVAAQSRCQGVGNIAHFFGSLFYFFNRFAANCRMVF